MSSRFISILRDQQRLSTAIVSTLLLASSALGVQRTALSVYSASFEGNFAKFIIVGAAISLAIFGGSKALGNIFGGRLADTRGRAFTSQVGMMILAIGSIILAFATTLEIFFLGNSIVGIGIGLLFASSAIALTDISTPIHRGKGISLMELSVYLGASIGAILAGNVAARWDFKATFVLALIIVSFAAISATFLKDTRSMVKKEERRKFLTAKEKLVNVHLQWIDHLEPEKKDGDLLDVFAPILEKEEVKPERVEVFPRTVLFQISFILTLTTGIVSRIADSGMILIFPLLIIEYGFSPVQLGIAISLFTLFWSIGIAIAGPFSDTVGRKTPLVVGLFLEAIGLLIMFALGLNKWFPLIVVSTIIAGFGRGLYFPIPPSATTDFVAPRHRGLLLGIYRFVLDFGYVIGAFLLILIIEPRYNDTIDSSSKRIDLLQPAMMVVVILLATQGILISFFFKDPRPGFQQFPQVKHHLDLISQTVHNIARGIHYYSEEDLKKTEEKLFIAKSFEREADQVLEMMTKATYAGVWRASDAIEILQFSTKVDKAAGHTIRAMRKFLLVDNKLPKNFLLKLRQYAVILDVLVETTSETLELVPIRMNLAVEQSYQVNYVEEFLDDIHKELWKEIVSMSSDITPLTTLLLSEAIDSLEKGANTLEDAAELIRLISFKH
ncbi:MAG: MFS transporter [Candidatus Kariarchaeaceae archaeon]|jgi:MFS family permease